MRLSDLNAKFLRRLSSHNFMFVATLAEADGINFLCPKCYLKNGGPRGTHSVICWAPHVPQDTSPTPGRWNMTGSRIDDLTLVAGSSSVQLIGGCVAHFHVQNGEIVGLT